MQLEDPKDLVVRLASVDIGLVLARSSSKDATTFANELSRKVAGTYEELLV
jgi:hypothetical protein